MIISFIIPVYNIEKYIGKCLKEFKKIKSTDCEFIIVNDGSTDESENICRKYCSDDKRFQIITKSNGGLSSARNEGLKHATGTWICFWDGDDWIREGFGDHLLELLDEKYDIFCFGMREIKSIDSEIDVTKFSSNVQVLSAEAIQEIRKGVLNVDYPPFKAYSGENLRFVSAWAKVFKKNFLINTDVLFNENIFWGEDVAFIFGILRKAKCLGCIQDIGYMYRMQPSSIMHSFKPNKKIQIQNLVNFIYEDIKKNNEMYLSDLFYLFGIKQFLYALKVDICHCDNHKNYFERKKDFYELKNNSIFRDCFSKGNMKKFRLEVKIIAILCKYNFFYIVDALLKFKEKFEVYQIKRYEMGLKDE